MTMNNIQWKKKLLSNTYSIYSNKQIIGKLENKTFSKKASGELNGKEYTFKTKGFLKQNTEIIDNKENKVIGEITYNTWMTKATISISKQSIIWKYDNAWNTKWSISNKAGIEIKYAGTSASGKIESNTDDALLLLSGLYVINYYWQMSIAVMVAVFIPILTIYI